MRNLRKEALTAYTDIMHVIVYLKKKYIYIYNTIKMLILTAIIIILNSGFIVIEWFQYNVVIVFSWFKAVCTELSSNMKNCITLFIFTLILICR